MKGFLTAAVTVAAAVLMAWPRGAFAQSGPNTTPEIVAAAAAADPPLPPGPFQPTWASIRQGYACPPWLRDAKFGIMMHWGLYAVPAHASEWYEKHMYGNPGITQWHTEKFGPPEKFGYKDFIPLFTCAKWDPDAWATLFRRAGAKYVIPTAEHHDGFALWDSQVNRWNAKAMGPHRDLIGDLAVAVRRQGLKFGVSHHGIEHFTFIQPTKGLATDLLDPKTADFYSVADRSDAACQRFLTQWVAENFELIDKYQPDVLWFDNGLNGRVFDPIKLKVAARYYDAAAGWGKAVSISTKADAYLAGSFKDYERSSRAPKATTDFPWEVDNPVLSRFGYTDGSPVAAAPSVIRLLIESVSKNGNLLLNISPKADGTIPDDQQALLLQIGKWLDVNGDAIYGTRPWTTSGEGKSLRFTTKGDALYAICYGNPGGELKVSAAALGSGRATGVSMLGHDGPLKFTQDGSGLSVQVPAPAERDVACAFKISGVVPAEYRAP